MYKRLIAVSVALIFLSACAGEENPNENGHETIVKDVQFIAPSNDAQFTFGETINVSIKVNNADMISDLEIWVDDTLYQGGLDVQDQSFTIETKNGRVGHVKIQLRYVDAAGENRKPDTRTVAVFSDIVPEMLQAVVVSTYSHNPKSYTQGLEFYKGKLYEGTGQYEQSKLAEVDLKTGEHIRSLDLEPTVFGEGITIMNDTIYQISYRAGKCFVYDLNTFEKINEFVYSGEGWGLSNNGKSLIMSNGGDSIVWRDPRSFQITKSIDVFDNQSNLGQINELELINGDLYANVYMDSKIAKIDTSTGKVLSYLDCSSIVNMQPAGVDVLNGIAHDEGKIYITGKWWPNLYEVTFQ